MPASINPSHFPAKEPCYHLPPSVGFQPGPAPKTAPVHVPAPPERWVVFEGGLVAHLMQDDDFFPAERTRCGRLPIDADLQPLPRFNTQPADYLFCLRCLPPRRTSFQVPLPIAS